MDAESECIPISEWPPPSTGDSDSDNTDNDTEEQFTKKRMINCENHPRLKRKRQNCPFPTAEKKLAGWVRSNLSRLKKTCKLSDITNPKTVLNIAAETTEGRGLLESNLVNIIEYYADFSEEPEYHYIIATYYDKLKYNQKALETILKSLILLEIDPEIMSDPCSIDYISVLKDQDELEKSVLWLYSKLSVEKSMKNQESVDRNNSRKAASVDYEEVNLDKFKEEFCKTKTPVVFTNVPAPTQDSWNLEFVREKAGSCKFEVKSPVTGSTEWAGLETTGQKTISQFLSDRVQGDGQYLFDWSLPLHAPLLNQSFTTPGIFQDDYLKLTSSSALYHSSWPSLFIANAGTNSGLHVDAFGSHFWMYLVSGRKKWTFYSPEDAGSLNPIFYDSLDPVFRPTSEQLESVESYEVELTEGQLLFVPSGSPHRVENIEDTVAVSGNFVNETNIGEVVKHLKINALTDPRAEDLLKEFIQMKLAH